MPRRAGSTGTGSCRNGTDAFFTLPLKKGSDFLDVVDRAIADDFDPKTLLNPLAAAYRKAPFFSAVFPVIESIVTAAPRNLFEFLHASIVVTAGYLEIRTPIVVSSTVAIDHDLKAQNKVLALCEALGATRYVNAIGGRELYSRADLCRAWHRAEVHAITPDRVSAVRQPVRARPLHRRRDDVQLQGRRARHARRVRPGVMAVRTFEASLL